MILPHTIVIWAVLTSAVTLLSPSRASAQEPTWSDTVETIAISPDGRLLATAHPHHPHCWFILPAAAAHVDLQST